MRTLFPTLGNFFPARRRPRPGDFFMSDPRPTTGTAQNSPGNPGCARRCGTVFRPSRRRPARTGPRPVCKKATRRQARSRGSPTFWLASSPSKCGRRVTAISAFGSVTKTRSETTGRPGRNLARLLMLAGQADAGGCGAGKKAALHHDGNPVVLDTIGFGVRPVGRPGGKQSRWIAKGRAQGTRARAVSRESGETTTCFLGALDEAQAVLDRGARFCSRAIRTPHWILANVPQGARPRATSTGLRELARAGHRNPRALAFSLLRSGQGNSKISSSGMRAFDAFRRGAEAPPRHHRIQ